MADVVNKLSPDAEELNEQENGPTTNTENSRESGRNENPGLVNIVTAPNHNVASSKALDLADET